MQRKPIFHPLTAALLIITIILAACTPAAPAPTQAAEPNAPAEEISVLTADGEEFRLEKPAQRIISLAPSNTEILFAIGAGSQVIGREEFSNYPPEAAEIPSVGGSFGDYNYEEIARLEPDLILISPLTAPEALQSLREITPNVFVVPNPVDLEEMFANLITVGELTGRKAEAEKLAADLRARSSAVLEKVSGVTERPKVFYELDATDPARPWTAGKGTFIDMLIQLAGGENVAASLEGEYPQISQEELIVQNPEIILLGDALYGGITPESVAARPGWEVIDAVKNGRVHPFNDDLVSRPGPRLVEGLETLAAALHPELFE